MAVYAVIDRAGDSFQIPIERAMELVVKERAGTTLHPAPALEALPSPSPAATP